MVGFDVWFREIFMVRDLTIGMILALQAVIWHPHCSEVPETKPPYTQLVAEYRRHAQPCAGITKFSPN